MIERASTHEVSSSTAPFDILLLCLGGAGLRLFLSLAMHSHRAGGSSPGFWGSLAATAVAAVLTGYAFLRLLRRREEWPLYLGVALLFILLFKAVKYRPELSSVELLLALFSLVPATILFAVFVRKVRKADELERRILGQALGIAFAVEFAATILYATAEAFGLPRVSAIMWCALLIASWSVALAFVSYRYRSQDRTAG
jgi:hypothetical protein